VAAWGTKPSPLDDLTFTDLVKGACHWYVNDVDGSDDPKRNKKASREWAEINRGIDLSILGAKIPHVRICAFSVHSGIGRFRKWPRTEAAIQPPAGLIDLPTVLRLPRGRVLELLDQAVLHPKHQIRIKILITGDKDVRHRGLVSLPRRS
jgi:hypothetical protein